MNREILIDALEDLDTGLIERYFEIKEKLKKKRIVTKSVMRWTVSAACMVLIACTVIPLAMRISQIPDPPVVETTVTGEEVTTDLPVWDPNKVYYEDYYGGFTGSRYAFDNWNGLFVASNLQNMLDSYYDKTRMYAINVFRHNDDSPMDNYVYEGKTYQDLVDEMKYPRGQFAVLDELLRIYGEILKYGKDVFTTTGIPEDDPLVSDAYKGMAFSAEMYDGIVARMNEYDPTTVSKYIVDGKFLREKAQADCDAFLAEANALSNKQKELLDSYYCRYKTADVAYFEDLGFITGEINGKLYIIVSYDQFLSLSKNADMSQFGFAALTREDYLDIYPNAIYPK